MLVDKSSVLKNSPHVVHRGFAYLQDNLFLLCCFFSWTGAFFLSLCVSSLVFSSSAHLPSAPSDTCKCPRIHSCTRTLLVFSHMHTFLACIFCWACSVWHSFYILMQNMLKGVYLKLQLFKHSKWSLWEGRGVQGMQTKATDDDLYVAHLPLPTKPCLQHWSDRFLAQSSFQQLLSL